MIAVAVTSFLAGVSVTLSIVIYLAADKGDDASLQPRREMIMSSIDRQDQDNEPE